MKRYYPPDQYNHAQNQAVTRGRGMVPIIQVRPWVRMFWAVTCTCGRYRSRHLTYSQALRAAEIHEVTHIVETGV